MPDDLPTLAELERAILDRIDVDWRNAIARVCFLPSPKGTPRTLALRAEGLASIAATCAPGAEVRRVVLEAGRVLVVAGEGEVDIRAAVFAIDVTNG